MHDMIKKYGKKVITYAFMILVAVVTILPFYTMIIMGTYRSADLLKGLKLLPGDYFIENFKTVINASYIRSYLNSIVVSALSAFLGSLMEKTIVNNTAHTNSPKAIFFIISKFTIMKSWIFSLTSIKYFKITSFNTDRAPLN